MTRLDRVAEILLDAVVAFDAELVAELERERAEAEEPDREEASK